MKLIIERALLEDLSLSIQKVSIFALIAATILLDIFFISFHNSPLHLICYKYKNHIILYIYCSISNSI